MSASDVYRRVWIQAKRSCGVLSRTWMRQTEETERDVNYCWLVAARRWRRVRHLMKEMKEDEQRERMPGRQWGLKHLPWHIISRWWVTQFSKRLSTCDWLSHFEQKWRVSQSVNASSSSPCDLSASSQVVVFLLNTVAWFSHQTFICPWGM